MYYYPYYFHVPMNYDIRQLNYWNYPHEYYGNYGYPLGDRQFTDQGPNPYVVDIEEATKEITIFEPHYGQGDICRLH